MLPIIDVHAHIFSARDIPLKGYLKSRRYTKFRERLFGPIIIPIIAKCLRKWRPSRAKKPLTIPADGSPSHLFLFIDSIIF